MSNLEITQRYSANVVILDLSGKIMIGESSIKFRTYLRQLMQKGEKNILLNLANVSHLDSSGLGEVVGSSASLTRNGGEVKLLHLTERVNELMMITKLLTVFEVYDDEEKAVNSFQQLPENAESNKSAIVTQKLNEAASNQ